MSTDFFRAAKLVSATSDTPCEDSTNRVAARRTSAVAAVVAESCLCAAKGSAIGVQSLTCTLLIEVLIVAAVRKANEALMLSPLEIVPQFGPITVYTISMRIFTPEEFLAVNPSGKVHSGDCF